MNAKLDPVPITTSRATFTDVHPRNSAGMPSLHIRSDGLGGWVYDICSEPYVPSFDETFEMTDGFAQ